MATLPFGRAASAAACALLLAAAPASAQRSTCVAGTEVRQPPGPQRAREAAEGELRAAIADTLHAGLLAAAAAEGISRPAGLVVVELASTREVRSVRILRGNLPDPLIQRVVAEHGTILTAWPNPGLPVFVRVDEPELPDGDSRVECMPRLRRGHHFQSALWRIARDNQQFLPPYGTVVNLLMLVDRDGRVVYATVPQLGASARLERQMIDAAYRLRFEPATVAGVAVEAWVEQPVEFPRDDR